MAGWSTSPAARNEAFVWAFIPYKTTARGPIAEFYDNQGYRRELADVFAELGIPWKWQPITLENMPGVVEEVLSSGHDHAPIVLNYCDGFDEIDGYPGLSVIEELEAKHVVFTGADCNFEYQTISKIRMKQTFSEAGIETAPWEVIPDESSIPGLCRRLGTPLIVKPSISTASQGIWLDSVVHDDRRVARQVKRLLQGEHGKACPQDGVFVERFINGREFAVLVLGSFEQPGQLKIFPSLERSFHPDLPDTEKLLSHHRYWGEEEEGSSFLRPDEAFCRYRLAEPDLHLRLLDLAGRAYCAVGGNGYGRVDIRMDDESQQLFVLEVNANCAISSKPMFDFSDSNATSVGTILYLAGIPFSQVMSHILCEATARHDPEWHSKHASCLEARLHGDLA